MTETPETKGIETMKKMTRNNLTNKPVIKIGYCDAQFMLKGLDRIGYMTGVYGWNCDVYDAGAAYIVTGYRFPGVSGIVPKYSDVKKADDIAEFILDHAAFPVSAHIEYSDRLETVANIRRDFIYKTLAAAA